MRTRNNKINIKAKYKPGDTIQSRTSNENLYISKMIIHDDKHIEYGCLNAANDIKWLNENEVYPEKKTPIGYNLEIK